MKVTVSFECYVEVDAETMEEAQGIVENYLFDSPFYCEMNNVIWEEYDE